MSAFDPKRDIQSCEHSSGKHAAWVRDQHAPSSARLTHLRLLDFRHSYYTGSGLLDHLNSDGFDCRGDGPGGFFHGRAFGLSPWRPLPSPPPFLA